MASKCHQAAKPWMSDRNIEKGTKGFTEIGKALEGKKVGVVCLTPENLEAVWILYEAGALSKTFSDDKTRLCTYLLGDLQSQDVKPPLSMFQSTKSEREDTRKLVQTINIAISEEPLPAERLNTIFNTFWPQLEEKLKAMPAPEKIVDARRDPNEMISEILDLCRQYLPGVGPTDADEMFYANRVPLSPSGHNSLRTLAEIAARKGGVNAPPPVQPVPPGAVWVKRRGVPFLEVVQGYSKVENPQPGTLVLYRGSDILAEFSDMEAWGYGGVVNS